jgi:intracellular multiplication protein IcmJ
MANLLPLVLSVKAANDWRMYDDAAGEADAEFKHVRLKVLDRDDRTCQFCGFRAPKWQEVHHRNDDHADNRPQNLVTACMFCHMCQHIGLAGRNKEAVLAFIPEIPQDRLHHVVRSILVVRRWADGIAADRRQRPELVKGARDMAESAQALETKLRGREADAQRLIGTSDPLELANILLQMAADAGALYDKRADFLAGIRLLPVGRRVQGGSDKMGEIIDSWLGTGGPYANLAPRTWVSLLKQHAI